MLGLVPFCQGNPRLRIERSVNLCMNVERNIGQRCRVGDVEQDSVGDGESSTHYDCRVQMARMVAEWLAEASVLCTVYGMPKGAFTLVLDHERPVGNYGLSAIRFLSEASGWQAVAEDAFMAKGPLAPWRLIDAAGQDTHSYQYRNVSTMIEALAYSRYTVAIYHGISLRKHFEVGRRVMSSGEN
ncbi:hypothetical protein QBC36DRAFT_357537 [Triangularia setosa]|uniref:Uncharacterized protein n=1 Tax=Triangularia setosa TaxID=2587417 RepID=A0AAN6WE84_9PEZI|nr:hypothetical protein QBC36DRAFT_357537 [Podospora setosa]